MFRTHLPSYFFFKKAIPYQFKLKTCILSNHILNASQVGEVNKNSQYSQPYFRWQMAWPLHLSCQTKASLERVQHSKTVLSQHSPLVFDAKNFGYPSPEGLKWKANIFGCRFHINCFEQKNHFLFWESLNLSSSGENLSLLNQSQVFTSTPWSKKKLAAFNVQQKASNLRENFIEFRFSCPNHFKVRLLC